MNRFYTYAIAIALSYCCGTAAVWIFANPFIGIAESNQTIAPSDFIADVQTQPSIEGPNSPIETVPENVEDTRIEYFTDEKKIGVRGKNKIEIRCFSRGAERFADIKFYSRTSYGAWIEMQSFRFEKDGVTDCDPVIEDFNNDGLKDFTYQSGVAARGANEVRKLFIYDRMSDELCLISNSEEYPNLQYNKNLKCVDSFIVTGTTETAFLRIEGNKLRQFASVTNGPLREVTITDETGKSRVVSRQKYNIDDFAETFRRFSSYAPLR